jgi:hypothetical protein
VGKINEGAGRKMIQPIKGISNHSPQRHRDTAKSFIFNFEKNEKRIFKMIGLCLLTGIFLAGCGQGDSGMDTSGNKVQTIDAAKLGKGKDALICPISGEDIKGKGMEIYLSNGKKIMVCCPMCKKTIEKDLKKYEPLMY